MGGRYGRGGRGSGGRGRGGRSGGGRGGGGYDWKKHIRPSSDPVVQVSLHLYYYHRVISFV